MSVVIAIKDGDHVLVGCDSQATYGGYKTRLTVEHNKAWYIDDCPNGVMGSVGSLRALQLIQGAPLYHTPCAFENYTPDKGGTFPLCSDPLRPLQEWMPQQ